MSIHDQIGHLFGRCAHPVNAVHCQEGFITILFKDEAYKLIGIHIVVNDQNAFYAHAATILRLMFTGNVYNQPTI
jgi:hypothetical protein